MKRTLRHVDARLDVYRDDLRMLEERISRVEDRQRPLALRALRWAFRKLNPPSPRILAWLAGASMAVAGAGKLLELLARWWIA